MKPQAYIFCFFLLYGFQSGAQKSLQIIRERFGNVKIYEVGVDDVLEYKLRGDHFFYKKETIRDLQDTIIFFKNDNVVTFSDLKAIRVRKQQHLFRTFRTVFLIGGIGLPALSIINGNGLIPQPPFLAPGIFYPAISMLGASFIIYELGIKHIRMNKRTTLRVLDRNYNNLNSKQ